MRLLVMAGDGIGEEITAATLEVLRSADARFGLGLEFEEAEIGLKALEKHGTTLPEGVLERARASDGIILGPISHLDYPPPEGAAPGPLADSYRRVKALSDAYAAQAANASN